MFEVLRLIAGILCEVVALFAGLITIIQFVTGKKSIGRINLQDILLIVLIIIVLLIVVGIVLIVSYTSEPSSRIPVGYEMEVYVTQEDAGQHVRNFRDYSVNKNYEGYNLRVSYGEKHVTCTVTAEEFETAVVYSPNDTIPGDESGKAIGGINKSSKDAYVMKTVLDSDGRYYPLFIKEVIYSD